MGTSKRWAAIAAVGVTALGGLALQVGTSGAASSVARAELRDVSGAVIGEVVFKRHEGEIVGQAEVVLPASSGEFHGFHIHANDVDSYPVGALDGDPADGCQASTSFTSVDGHWSLAGQQHGGDATHPAHSGDLPVLMRDASGHAETEFVVGKFTPEDIIGRAVIVHVGADNYANVSRYGTADGTTLNTGDAGGRFACGVIEPRSG
jgi:Cu-Zn family superoxide dismutase